MKSHLEEAIPLMGMKMYLYIAIVFLVFQFIDWELYLKLFSIFRNQLMQFFIMIRSLPKRRKSRINKALQNICRALLSIVD